ncbi:EAL domain-containing protein [Noviherbaspirillum saxi]|uniref:EAL domain-containing protein n=1 Tax=Noviherbaspirillum saxi TaxID=2320863 RepID=A0A3A3FV58_9BURK|nr:EAL domain-containing protein [Noviherbaspirillum saxi]RJF99500.1 EAL domain-containing protein [Noviherbaspirillum saxi]
MAFPGLENYLERLYGTTQADTRVWIDAEGRAQGRYFNSTLTSAFQPIRALGTGLVVGYEGFARSNSGKDQGLCLWKLLDHAANDDESVELDRLCRVLHAINFFRQPAALGSDLYLSVHARLLAAVDGNHGTAFSRVLRVLDLPQQRIVLQLPVIPEHQAWLLNYVADNYRRNGFRIAVKASGVTEALSLINRVHPEAIKVDTRQGIPDELACRLLEKCAEQKIRVIFKRIEHAERLQQLERVAKASGQSLLVQDFVWDLPAAAIARDASQSLSMPSHQPFFTHADAA